MVVLVLDSGLNGRRDRDTATTMIARYASDMSGIAMFKLFLTGYAIVGIAYVCIASGAFSREQENWWGTLSQRKKGIFISAIAATVLQGFL